MYRRIVRALPALAAFVLASGLTVVAQEPDQVVIRMSRPRLGVMLESGANAENDKLGATVTDVTPESPAAKAGLKAGDIITTFNGTALGGAKAGDESGPSKRLRELAGKLEPGDTVRIEYRRGTESKKATLVAAELPGMTMRHFEGDGPGEMRSYTFTGPEDHMMAMPPEGAPRMRWFGRGGPEGPGTFNVTVHEDDDDGLELATLNLGLGEYFGAKAGVLVLEAPEDSTLQLKAGDVIVSIDGRAPTSEAHARRILRSYQEGETAKFEVLRKQKKVTVSWKATGGEHTKVFMRRMEGGPEMKVEVTTVEKD